MSNGGTLGHTNLSRANSLLSRPGSFVGSRTNSGQLERPDYSMGSSQLIAANGTHAGMQPALRSRKPNMLFRTRASVKRLAVIGRRRLCSGGALQWRPSRALDTLPAFIALSLRSILVVYFRRRHLPVAHLVVTIIQSVNHTSSSIHEP